MSERSFFQLHVGMKIDLGGLSRFVAEPKSNDAEIHAAAQQRHGRRMPKRVRFHFLGFERWATQAGRCNVLGHQALQCIGAETSPVGTGEDRIVGLASLLRQSFLEDGRNVGAQRRASQFTAFPEATDVSADAEFDIASAKSVVAWIERSPQFPLLP